MFSFSTTPILQTNWWKHLMNSLTCLINVNACSVHNVWCIKNRTKLSSVLLLWLVWFLMHQTLAMFIRQVRVRYIIVIFRSHIISISILILGAKVLTYYKFHIRNTSFLNKQDWMYFNFMLAAVRTAWKVLQESFHNDAKFNENLFQNSS